MREAKDETDWQRQLLIGVLVLVAVGALIGGIVAVISIKAADLAGIDNTKAASTREQRPRMSEDTGPGSTDATEPTEPTDSTSTDPTGPSSGSTSGSQTTKPPKPQGIVFEAGPESVAAGQNINLSGTYAAPDGTVLQIQRKEGGQWIDFPVTISVNGGGFATHIYTSHTGANVFRLSAIGRSDISNTVTIQVG